MFRNISLVLFLSLTAPFVAACTEAAPHDELAGESAADDVTTGKADSDALATFFTVTRDQRKCAAPMCGGYFVSRVNHAKTSCADGVNRTSCYVAAVDADALGLADRELQGFWDALGTSIVLRGDLSMTTIANHDVGLFTASEAWQAGAAEGSPDGVWVLAALNDIRCVAAPCLSITERKLNSTLSANIGQLDFDPSGATDDEIAKAQAALGADGVIVAGDREYVQYEGRTVKARGVTQFFTRMAPSVQ